MFIFVRVPLLVKDIGGFCWVYKSSIIGFIHWENFVCCNNTFVLNWIEVWEGRIEEQRTGGSQELELMRLHRQSMNPIRFHVPPSIFSHPFIKDSIMRLVSIAIIAFFFIHDKGNRSCYPLVLHGGMQIPFGKGFWIWDLRCGSFKPNHLRHPKGSFVCVFLSCFLFGLTIC